MCRHKVVIIVVLCNFVGLVQQSKEHRVPRSLVIDKPGRSLNEVNLPIGKETNSTQVDISFTAAKELVEALLDNPVLVSQRHLHNTSTSTRLVDFSIDSSIQEALFEISTDGSEPNFEIFDAEGVSVEDSNSSTVLSGQTWTLVSVSSPGQGIWKVQLSGNQSYDIALLGDSICSFKTDFVDRNSGKVLYGYPVAGLIQQSEEHRVPRSLVINKPGGSLNEVNLQTGKEANSTLVDISFTAAKELAEALLDNPVLVSQCHLHNISTLTRVVDFSIDSSIQEALFEISTDGTEPNFEIFDAEGASVEDSNTSTVLSGQTWTLVSVSSPVQGTWKVQLLGNQSYEITLLGDSIRSFKTDFVDRNSGKVLNGHPVADKNVTLEITLSYGVDHVDNTSKVFLTNEGGVEVSTYPLGQPHGSEKDMYFVPILVPEKAFRVKVVLNKTNATQISRVTRQLYHPTAFNVDLSPPLPDTVISGSVISVTLRIRNYRAVSETFHVYTAVQDGIDVNSPLESTPPTLSIRPHSFSSYNVTFDVPNTNRKAEEITILVRVKNSQQSEQKIEKKILVLKGDKKVTKQQLLTPSSSDAVTSVSTIFVTKRKTISLPTRTSTVSSFPSSSKAHDQSLITTSHSKEHRYTVTHDPGRQHGRTTEATDINPPAFNMISFQDKCKHKKKCSTHHWTVFFQVQDNESGIHRVFVEDKTSSSVITERFSDGQANTPVHGNVSTTCCQGRTVIIVEDMMGNRERYPVRYKDHVLPKTDTNTGLTFNQYSGIVVASLACVLLMVIIVTSAVHFRSKLCFKKSQYRYSRSIGGKMSYVKRDTASAQVV